jgi:hypothetical protein
MMETGPTLVRKATKHSPPMANVARLNKLLISNPVPFLFRVDAADSNSLICRVRKFLFERQERYPIGRQTLRGAPSAGDDSEAYSSAILIYFKSMPNAFATPAP